MVFAVCFLVAFVLTRMLSVQLYRLGSRYRKLHELARHPMKDISGVSVLRLMFEQHDDTELSRLGRSAGRLFALWSASVAVTFVAFGSAPFPPRGF